MANGDNFGWIEAVIVLAIVIGTGAIWTLLDPLAAGIDVWTDTFW